MKDDDRTSLKSILNNLQNELLFTHNAIKKLPPASQYYAEEGVKKIFEAMAYLEQAHREANSD